MKFVTLNGYESDVMDYLKSLTKTGTDPEPVKKALNGSLKERDFYCRKSRGVLGDLGIEPDVALALLAHHKSSVKYGYDISTGTPLHVLKLAGTFESKKRMPETPLKKLAKSPFFLAKSCWLYEHAPHFFFFEKGSAECDNLVIEYARRLDTIVKFGGGLSKKKKALERKKTSYLESERKRVMMTTFWESKIIDPLLMIEKTKKCGLEGMELCVDFHPFNFTKLLPEEYTRNKREEIREECRKSRIKLDIHSPIVGPYVPNPDGGKQRFYNPATCLNIQSETVELAKDIGAGCIVFHLIDPSNVKKLASLVEKAAGSDVRVTIENYCQTDALQNSDTYIACVDEIYSILPEELAKRNFGVTMDVGHLNIEGEDPLVGAEKIGRWCRDKGVFLRVHATDNYGKLLFSPPAYSADVHSNVSGKGIDNALIIKLLRSMGLRFEVVAEQIKPLTPADIATIHEAQTYSFDRPFSYYCRIGRKKLSSAETGTFVRPEIIKEKAYNFLVGLKDIAALREYLVYRRIQDKKHLYVDDAKKVSQDFRKVSKKHKIDLTSYIDDLLLPIQNESGSVQKSELDLLCQNISSVIYETLGEQHLDRIFSQDKMYRNGETIYEQHSPGREIYLVKEGEVRVFIDGVHSATLEKGKVFGEIGLFYNIDRSASIKASVDETKIGVLNRKGLEDLFVNGQPVAHELIFRLYNILPQRLRNLNEKYKSAITALYLIRDGDKRNMPDLGHVQMENRLEKKEFFPAIVEQEIQEFDPGQVIFAEGDKADGAYYIIEGKVKVVVSSENYNEILLGKLDSGKFFGEMSLIDDKPRSASIVTITPSKIAFISKKVFDEFIDKKSELAFRLMGFICLSLYRSIIRLDKFYSEVKDSGEPVPKSPLPPDMAFPGRLGEYLTIDPKTIVRGLNLQQQYALKGIRKLLGQILIEMQAITRERLIEAIHLQRYERLRTSPLFTNLTEEEVKNLSGLVYERNVKPGEVFIQQDTTGDSFFILVHGEAMVFRTGEFDEDITLALFGPGECIGEMGYFSDRKRSASVRAITDSRLIEINYDDLNRAFEIAPKLAGNFLDIVTRRLRRLNLRLQDSYQKSKIVESSLENLRSLLDLTDVIALRTGIDGVIQRVVMLAGKVMNAERATLFLLDFASGELWSKVAQGDGMGEIRLPMDRGVAGWVVTHDEILNIPDAYEDPRFDREVDVLTNYRTQSILCGPVKNLHGEIIGVVEVINKTGGIFNSDDEIMFKAFASQTAIAVENFHLYNQIVKNHEKMTIFLDVATSVSRILDIDRLSDSVSDKVSKILDTEHAALFLIDEKTKEFLVKKSPSASEKIRFPVDWGLPGHAAKTGRILNIKNAYEDPEFDSAFDCKAGLKTRSVLCIPVFGSAGNAIGAIQAINKKNGLFDADDEEIMRTLSSQFATAIENALMYKRTLDRKDQLEKICASISGNIVTMDEKYRVVTASRAALELLSGEKNAERIIGGDIRDVIGKANESLLLKIDRALESKCPESANDLEITLPGGKRRSLNIDVFPLSIGNQGGRGVALVFDTHRKKT